MNDDLVRTKMILGKKRKKKKNIDVLISDDLE